MLDLSDYMNFNITIVFIKTLQFSIIARLWSNQKMTIYTQLQSKFYWTFLVASYGTHLYTLVCDSLDVNIWHHSNLHNVVSDDFSYE